MNKTVLYEETFLQFICCIMKESGHKPGRCKFILKSGKIPELAGLEKYLFGGRRLILGQ